jgi:CubicO group peptidase (beta-lactamase class C family)
MKRVASLLCALGVIACQGGAPVLPPAPPLAELHQYMQGVIDSGDYLGAVTLIARHGKVVDWRAFGHRDLARTEPMDPDSIFRIYSMTKTVTTVAVLMLMEDGRLSLDDPIAQFLPEFADMQVFTGGTADAPQLRQASRPITIRNLLIHAAGFAVGGKDAPEAVRILERADLGSSPDLRTYCERLSRVPLAVDPGSRFNYDGVQIVVLGRLIEAVAGVSFADFLHQSIFAPLSMVDTGFSLPAAKRGRLVEMTSTDRDGRLMVAPEYAGKRAGEMLNPYDSGAGGLYSTAADYLRFSQMLLNGGSLDGVTIIFGTTVGMMMTNQLGRLDPPATEFNPGEGFGLGGSVVVDVGRRGRLGSVGQFGWSGAAATYYTIDRKEGLIAMLLMQHLPQGLPEDPPKISATFYNLVYQSLAEQSWP